jgi:membrane fusion protein (multidrug efflux system)
MRWRAWLLTFLFVFSVIGLLGFVKFNQVMAAIAFGNSFPEPSETVKVKTLSESNWQPTLNLAGSVLPTRSLEIRNELEGIVTYIGFASGGKVKAGQVLLKMQVDDELAQLDAIDAEIKIAELDVNRFEKLLEQRASSRDQYDRAKAQLAVANARKRSLEAIIAKKTIVAPFDGQAGLHQLEVGAFLSGNTLVTKLISDTKTVWVDFNIPQAYSNVEVGSVLRVSSSILNLPPTAAKLIAVDQEISTRSRNMRARAELTTRDFALKPGAIVTVSLPAGNTETVARLPTKAIRYDAFGTYVFKLTKDENDDYRASRQVVKVITTEGETSVLKLSESPGLELGDTIATQGSFKLRSDILVYVDDGRESVE